MKFWTVGFILFVGAAESARVLPRPTLDIGEVTPYSITLTWTMPPNEIFEEFAVEMVPDEGSVDDFNPRDMRRKFTNLTPGTLYTFTVRTIRDESFSDPVTIRQDTRPLVPNNLNLRSFDTLVLTMDGPLFGDIEFTVEAHGVEASWDSPADGISECYHAEISYADSGEVIPADNGQESRDEPLRQFINLVPGRTYTVTVYSATCGQGHLGELRSDGISEDIFLPPAPPPDLVHEETSTSVELTWGPPESEYDDFLVVETTVLDGSVTVEDETNKTRLGRTVTGLQPCTEYDFEIYSIFREVQSESPTRVSVLTRPLNDVIVSVASFDETSVTFDLRSPSNAAVQYELTLLPSGQTVKTNGSRVTFRDLTPGLTYSVTASTSCRQDETVTSTEIVTIEQTTKPSQPVFTVECRPIGVNQTESDLYHEVSIPWVVPEYSRMTLSWPLPTSGTWDNFLVDYSPHVFEEGLSSPAGPILLSADTTTITVDVPVTGRVMTVSVRSLSNNVLSEPDVRPAFCGADAVLHCKSYLIYWNIIITPIENNQLRVEIPNFPIHNATIYVGGQVSVFYVNTFIIPNPCETNPFARIVVYPRCPDILPFCPVIIRPICPLALRRQGGNWENNACCHNRLYNTENQICCRNKLISIGGRTNEQCCLRGWYDGETRKCCRNGDTVLNDGICPIS